MGIIEKLEELNRSRQEDNAKREAEIRKYQERLDGVNAEIDKAIDAADFGKVEKLNANKRDLENKIDTLRIINERNRKYAISRPEVAAEWNREVPKMQKQIDAAAADVTALFGEMARGLLVLAEVANQARDNRRQLLTLIGDLEPGNFNVGNKEFLYNSVPVPLIERLLNIEQIKNEIRRIDPEGLRKVRQATASQSNIYFRFSRERHSEQDTTEHEPASGFSVAIPGRS